ncbi:5-formyltetrahydrofolate cyclo-ligase [Limnobacter sp.]|uniref:5-formyltetrahydrofolate cyclo-ligase n=1 Tax=Limnobacter sp. TaxID=2003368 RepID=UPI0033904DA1
MAVVGTSRATAINLWKTLYGLKNLAGFMSMNPINKIELRKNLINRRLSLNFEQIEVDSILIKQALVTLLQSLDVCTVALYYPIKQEPDLLAICESTTLDKVQWCLPRCRVEGPDRWLDFLQFKAGDPLVSGLYQIPTPQREVQIVPDCLVLPCVGFNRDGARLGYGAGWYDRTLEKSMPKYTIGVAYDWSELAVRFQEKHDRLMSFVVTPTRVMKTAPTA